MTPSAGVFPQKQLSTVEATSSSQVAGVNPAKPLPLSGQMSSAFGSFGLLMILWVLPAKNVILMMPFCLQDLPLARAGSSRAGKLQQIQRDTWTQVIKLSRCCLGPRSCHTMQICQERQHRYTHTQDTQLQIQIQDTRYKRYRYRYADTRRQQLKNSQHFFTGDASLRSLNIKTASCTLCECICECVSVFVYV